MNHPSLSPDDLALITAEQDCLNQVSETLAAAQKRQRIKQIEDDELVALRDQLAKLRRRPCNACGTYDSRRRPPQN